MTNRIRHPRLPGGGPCSLPHDAVVKFALAAFTMWCASPQLCHAFAGDFAWRRPVAAVLLNEGARVAVANETTGTISLLAVGGPDAGGEVLSESPVAKSLGDLAVIPGSEWFLATDPAEHEVIALRLSGNDFERGRALAVARFPASVSVSADGTHAAVTSLWSRKLTLLSVSLDDSGVHLRRTAEIPLPFNPRREVILPDQEHLVVADAFGGSVAVVDLTAGAVLSVRELPGSNLRGLAVSRDGRTLAVSHQIPNHLARTTNDDIHWGMLMQNVVRLIDMPSVLDSGLPLYRASRLVFLGQPGAGNADPAGVVELPSGEWLVAVSGVDEVQLTRSDSGSRARISVGARPTEVLWDERSSRGFVLNQLSDSLSVIDTSAGALRETISLGGTPELTPATRGERLFYNAALSHDRWLSCHSCHSEGHSTGHLVDTKSDGSFGTPKRILSLLGTRDANPWAWNGGFRELHEQVRASVVSSMQGKGVSPDQVNDLVAFLHTLKPAPPLAPSETPEQEALATRGKNVFLEQGCNRCHVPDLTYTSDGVYDVGFEDEQGLRNFNPPFLRGVSQRGLWFHDGRAASLEDVFVQFSHQLSRPLSDEDLRALVQFLESL